MTKEHLPECPCNHADERGCFLISAETDRCVDCICPQLRACEQRVREDMALQYLVSDREQQEAEQRAYAAGLEAAREAVERVSSLFQPLGPALAAIDALRNPPSLPPTTGRAHKY